ncbi:hypothetical protein Sru01_20940 [Sphaerisporangium rufum]|uniref:Uncharacterized protein n=1 Tax=Sphaerisporangium rufum TaxID=1381558 RepID=A0A919V080_9ACTN|nr:hypothetical protein Sru01_20940 [Sphaerisporangium rufum]
MPAVASDSRAHMLRRVTPSARRAPSTRRGEGAGIEGAGIEGAGMEGSWHFAGPARQRCPDKDTHEAITAMIMV